MHRKLRGAGERRFDEGGLSRRDARRRATPATPLEGTNTQRMQKIRRTYSSDDDFLLRWQKFSK
ncbi:hypothetical protein [Mycobacterium kubicae]|uniref:hypothetical protein n=1 Tax=Mycobacterium kubicae TaxID=120959 RepID=UPI000B092C49|nr:hypothetical protein [Mycobacterium kubicae]